MKLIKTATKKQLLFNQIFSKRTIKSDDFYEDILNCSLKTCIGYLINKTESKITIKMHV